MSLYKHGRPEFGGVRSIHWKPSVYLKVPERHVRAVLLRSDFSRWFSVFFRIRG